MDNIREKLVELMEYARQVARNKCKKHYNCVGCPVHNRRKDDICQDLLWAEELIANGVAVQEWRPASEPPKEDGRYFVARYDSVTKTPFTDILWFERGQWWNRLHGGNFAVTHWMPLPSAPKGE